MRHNESEIILLKDKEWSVIDGEPCRVTAFNPLGSFIDVDGEVQSPDNFTPYAGITIECQKLGKNVSGFITHKIDFKHLWAAFRERTVKEDEEVIICWTRKNYKAGVKYFSSFMPKLWVMICPKGAFELITDNSYKPELTGLERWEAHKPIVDWKPEVME
jgi:hypothetical protein